MTPVPIIQGAVLTTAAVIYYTAPSNDPQTKKVQLTGMRFTNTDSVARTVTVYVVPPGGSVGVSNTRFKTLSLEAAGSPSAYFLMDDVLLPGATIQALASAANVVSISATGVSYP